MIVSVLSAVSAAERDGAHPGLRRQPSTVVAVVGTTDADASFLRGVGGLPAVVYGMDDPPPPYQRYPPACDAFPPLRERRDSDSEGDGDPQYISAKYREWKREWRGRMAHAAQ